MKRKFGFGWTIAGIVLFIGLAYVISWAAGSAGYTVGSYGTRDTKENYILKIEEKLHGTGADTLKGVAAGTTSTYDVHNYDQFATYVLVSAHDADSGNVVLKAMVSPDDDNWVLGDSETVRTASDSAYCVVTWTLPPAPYFKVIYVGQQNTVDSTRISSMYHIFQQ